LPYTSREDHYRRPREFLFKNQKRLRAVLAFVISASVPHQHLGKSVFCISNVTDYTTPSFM
jgi:hypothetical protein